MAGQHPVVGDEQDPDPAGSLLATVASRRADAMFAAVEEITRPHVVGDGSVEIEAEYLVVVARRH